MKNASYLYVIVLSMLCTACAKKPAAPSDLQVSIVADTALVLTWKDWSDNEDGFAIYESRKAAGGFGLLSKTNEDVVEYKLFNKEPGVELHYYVCSFRGERMSEPTVTVSVISPVKQLPTAPTELSAVLDKRKNVQLSWNDNSTNETGFEIERRLENDFNWTKLNIVTADENTYLDDERELNLKYVYRVRAFSMVGHSPYSNECIVEKRSVRKIEVISPNGGEVYSKDDVMIIRWKADNSIGRVKIIFRTKENFWYKAVNWTENDGVYEYHDLNSLMDSETYRLRIGTVNPNLYDESDMDFAVRN